MSSVVVMAPSQNRSLELEHLKKKAGVAPSQSSTRNLPTFDMEIAKDDHASNEEEIFAADESKDLYRARGSWFPFNRWMGLSAAMIMMGCNGLTYTFAVYSEFIKKRLHYSQENVDDLGAAKDFGALFGLVSGLIYFLFPPWASVLIGAVMHFSGYIVILLTLAERMQPSFWLLCFFSAIGTGGDAFVDTACIMTNLESFRDQKGAAIGLLKSQLGLSAAIFVIVYKAFMGSTVLNFLLLITFIPSLVYGGLAFLIRPYHHNEEEMDQSDGSQRFTLVSIFVVILGVFLMGIMTMEGTFIIDGFIAKFFAVSMLLILLTILLIPLCCKPIECLRLRLKMMLPRNLLFDHVTHEKYGLKTDTDEELGVDDDAVLPRQDASRRDYDDDGGGSELDFKIPGSVQAGLDPTYPSTWGSLQGINFWLITFVVSSGAGSGLAIINNFAQIGKAMKNDGVEDFVGIISIWSCFGRLFSGYGSDLMMKTGYSRPFCLLISQAAMSICCILLSTGSTPYLFIGAAVIGLAYGSYWTLAPTIISEVFGLRQVATLYKFLGLGPTIAAYILSGKVLGYLYDRESIYYRQQHHDIIEDNACYGRRCFELGLLSLASVCFVGVVACLWFIHRTKKMYTKYGYVQIQSST